ncbi:MAG: VWA domain-containing protein [Acidobacteria bacterium]|nr:VWA domain-containing protein [Acidobacteriota bacterium]
MRRKLDWSCAAALLLASGVAAEEFTLKVNSDLTTMNVSVKERRTGRAVTDLTRADFLVFEDAVEQQISHFSSVETPFSLLLLLDISGSTLEKFPMIQEASIAFVRSLNPDDELAIAAFNSELRLLEPFGKERPRAVRSILGINPGGGTAFYDALHYSISKIFAGISGRKALVVFTDGVDNQLDPRQAQNGSRTAFPELFRLIQESDVVIYPIFLNTEREYAAFSLGNWNSVDWGSIFGRWGKRKEKDRDRNPSAIRDVQSDLYQNALQELEKVAEQTGGTLYAPEDVMDLDSAYRKIGDELRVQYSLGYASSNAKEEGAWRSIKVKIRGDHDYGVKARKGYYYTSGGLASRSRPGRRVF